MFKTYLPLKWAGHLPVNDFGRVILLDVEFISCFGPFCPLGTVGVLEVDFVEGWMRELNEQGQEVRRCDFFASPTRRQKSVPPEVLKRRTD